MRKSMGVLRLNQAENKFHLRRIAPSDDVGFFVKHYWIVSWDLIGQKPHHQQVIPNPCINLIFEQNGAKIYGIQKGMSTQYLKDKGQVFGVKFKPGGFYPFLQSPVSTLSHGPTDFHQVFGEELKGFAEDILLLKNEKEMVEQTEGVLKKRLPAPDEQIIFINQLIDIIHSDAEITKVDQLCERFNMNKRKLQRLFDDYVGVGPKWVIRLNRLQQAAEKMDAGLAENWVQLAADLGYYDQAHFIRDFKGFVGKTPEVYVKWIDQR